MSSEKKKPIFIDQIFGGFDLDKKDYGVRDFIKPRKDIIRCKNSKYILEFMELNVDTYENLVTHKNGKLNTSHRNVLMWTDPRCRKPHSVQYWNLAEFKKLLELLKKQGIKNIMLRSFFKFCGKTGHGRYLRNENNAHTACFEWRRADEFLRRHPEINSPDHEGYLNWHAQLRPDPLYNIPAGLTAGNWFLQQLCSLYNELGINAVRFGDGSYGEASLTKNELFKKLFTQMNRDTLAACKKNRITFFTTLGPYWSFDAWRDELHCDFDKLAAVSEYVIYQTFEGWTDKYGITYVHNGEYFNAGCGNLHLLVNSVLTGKTAYIRGLDSGDPIENWHPPAAMPLRQSLESFTLFCREKDTYCRPCHGVYHFWSQDLDKNYYKKQKKLHNFFQKNQPHKVYGPELVVTRGCKPHLYIMGDFFETSGYGLRTAVSPDNIVPAAGKTYVFFLPRTSGQPVLDETAMTAAEQKQFSNLLASPANIIVFGGAADADFLEYFQLEYTPAEFTPLRWQAGEQEGKWKDHAADSFHPQMAGQKEKYFRKDYLHFKPGGCKVLAAAIAETGEERVLAAAATNPAGGQRMFISGLPTAAVKTVAERTIAASCSLPYRISSAADITSFMWQAENGSVFLAVERYDKIDDAPAIVTVQSGFQLKPVLHSETFRQEQALFIRPHGFIIFKTVN